MPVLFSSTDREVLKRPHVGQSIHVDLDHPTLGMLRFHGGVGRVTANGQVWKGVSSPDGRQMAQVGMVSARRFNQAVAVEIAISGANAEFMSEIKTTARSMEGRAANVYFAIFDAETQQELLWRKVLPGFMTAPRLVWEGVGTRLVLLTIESEDQAKNFSTVEKWSPAGIRKRYGADVKGLDFMGVDVKEVRK